LSNPLRLTPDQQPDYRSAQKQNRNGTAADPQVTGPATFPFFGAYYLSEARQVGVE
jgi:hypothetical protein